MSATYYDNSPSREDRRVVRRRLVNWLHWPETTSQPHFTNEKLDLSERSRPDIEDDALISWGLKQARESQGGNTAINVLYGEGPRLQWRDNINDDDLEHILQTQPTSTGDHSLRMCFLNTLEPSSGWLPGNFEIRSRTFRILRDFGLSKSLLKNIYSKDTFWAKMGNQLFLRRNEKGDLLSFDTCYQYVCGWDTGVSFINYIRTPNQTTYFCINCPTPTASRLRDIVESKPLLAHRDFLLDSLVADDCLKQWQLDIGSRRDKLIHYERVYDENLDTFREATIELHQLARSWLTLRQDSQDLYAQLHFLRESYVKYKGAVGTSAKLWSLDQTDMCESFDMLISACDTCSRWTSVYHERTSLRINLLFQLSNQRDSKTNIKIADATADVALLTQRDSASMITIAAVTMLFLPGTFISAILSTTFFDYGDEGLRISKRWWILPASTIPLTIVVFAIWLGWRYLRFKKLGNEKKIRQKETLRVAITTP
ncbi:hypothetical protein BKA58DRAFT_456590 [Alternaria rosae]|uniref:uncharacterized protein n=1 Tax=Alternaria rosae TaxID=1187941 RepID=UPI001E8D7677|nr:uncharacterized protein BKA58DRAFT_456590 [Alternaria rosae]KAH6872932.1 hypothetical protein BKA58DRAFT_456590 [Alternaria rosae]